MSDEDYLTPLVGEIIGGIIIITLTYVGTKLMTRWVDKKTRKIELKEVIETEI
jgi:hypothetical protein